MADNGRLVSWEEWRGWWASAGTRGWFARPAEREFRAQHQNSFPPETAPAPDLRTERLSTEALQRLQAWLYPESVELTLEDRAMLAMMGIRWP